MTTGFLGLESSMRVLRGVVVLLLIQFVGACASASGRAAVVAPPALSNGVTWVQRAAEYQAAVAQTYRMATAHVETAAAARLAGTWAVVLDADETVITNLTYQVERERAGLPYSSESWGAWVRRREATPLPGASAFLSRIRALGGRIAIVTNRLESECADTQAVFRAHELAFDVMLCRPDGLPSDKAPRFAAVAAGTFDGATGPLEVVAFMGDNILDFPGLSQAGRLEDDTFSRFGVDYFVLPNPMYGSWQP